MTSKTAKKKNKDPSKLNADERYLIRRHNAKDRHRIGLGVFCGCLLFGFAIGLSIGLTPLLIAASPLLAVVFATLGIIAMALLYFQFSKWNDGWPFRRKNFDKPAKPPEPSLQDRAIDMVTPNILKAPSSITTGLVNIQNMKMMLEEIGVEFRLMWFDMGRYFGFITDEDLKEEDLSEKQLQKLKKSEEKEKLKKEKARRKEAGTSGKRRLKLSEMTESQRRDRAAVIMQYHTERFQARDSLIDALLIALERAKNWFLRPIEHHRYYHKIKLAIAALNPDHETVTETERAQYPHPKPDDVLPIMRRLIRHNAYKPILQTPWSSYLATDDELKAKQTKICRETHKKPK